MTPRELALATPEVEVIAAASAVVVEEAAVEMDLAAVETELAAQREELRQIMIKPEHCGRFLHKGRLVYMKSGPLDWGWGIVVSVKKEPQWSVRVLLACKADSPASKSAPAD